MRKIYFAGKFNKIKDKTLSLEAQLENDYRSKLLGTSKLLTYANDNLVVDNKYIYQGPFYCEQASTGDYTSTDCNTVINAEYKAICDSDMVLVVFDEDFSVGSVVELGWAINQDKEIVILYKEEASQYEIKSEYWFAIADAIKRGNKVDIYQYKNNEDLLPLIKQILEEN